MPRNPRRQSLESTASIVLSLCPWHCAPVAPLLYPVAPSACAVAQLIHGRIALSKCSYVFARSKLGTLRHRPSFGRIARLSVAFQHVRTTAVRSPQQQQLLSTHLIRRRLSISSVNTRPPSQLLLTPPEQGLRRGICLHYLRCLRVTPVGKVSPPNQETPRGKVPDPYFHCTPRSRSRPYSRHFPAFATVPTTGPTVTSPVTAIRYGNITYSYTRVRTMVPVCVHVHVYVLEY